MDINLRDVWKRYTVSTVILLPLFNDVFTGLKSMSHNRVEFTFLQLCFEYGLINCYLSENGNNYTLSLYFDADEVHQNKNLTISKYQSFNDMIVDSSVFEGVRVLSKDVIVYNLRISPKFNQDIELIKQGKYSKTSIRFKEAIRVKFEHIPKASNPYGLYLTSSNLGYYICKKAANVKKALETIIKQELSEDAELFINFDEKKEYEEQRTVLPTV